jgi:uncharacterized protein (TIGR03083 family)
MMTATRIEAIPAITKAEARELAATEYTRLVDQLRTLSAEDWAKPTDCPLWDVRAVAGHNLGMMSDFTSFPTLIRRMRAATMSAKATGELFIDVMTAMQVADNATLSTADLIAHTHQIGPKAARWRTGVPRLFGWMPMKQEFAGTTETWRMGYLLDIILTRDPWMHRVDIARATGRDLVLTAGHDGRIVADVVGEWARRHGKPFTLTLIGPAGGEFTAGASTGEQVTSNAVEFCRTVSGRAEGHGLLSQRVPF